MGRGSLGSGYVLRNGVGSDRGALSLLLGLYFWVVSFGLFSALASKCLDKVFPQSSLRYFKSLRKALRLAPVLGVRSWLGFFRDEQFFRYEKLAGRVALSRDGSLGWLPLRCFG